MLLNDLYYIHIFVVFDICWTVSIDLLVSIWIASGGTTCLYIQCTVKEIASSLSAVGGIIKDGSYCLKEEI